MCDLEDQNRQVTRTNAKSGAMVEHQRMFVILKTTPNAKGLFKSGAAPLYRSSVTFLQRALYRTPSEVRIL